MPTTMPEQVKLLSAFVADQNRRTLADWAGGGPLLLVFLRHFGCVFNRPVLTRLQQQRAELEKAGVRIALVHMSTDRQADLYLQQHGLNDLPRFSDPTRQLYRAFGLRRAALRELLTAGTLRHGVEACVRERQFFSIPQGDPLQMPGYFLLEYGRITAEFVPEQPWEVPDYRQISGPMLAHLALL